jgi:hypothetical protein
LREPTALWRVLQRVHRTLDDGRRLDDDPAFDVFYDVVACHHHANEPVPIDETLENVLADAREESIDERVTLLGDVMRRKSRDCLDRPDSERAAR